MRLRSVGRAVLGIGAAVVGCGLAWHSLLGAVTGGLATLLALFTVTDATARGQAVTTAQIKAPEGYDLHKPAHTFTAGPGAPVTVTVANAKTAGTASPTPAEKSTHRPTGTPATPTSTSTEDSRGGPEPVSAATGSPDAQEFPATATTHTVSPKTPAGSFAHTGTDATPWLLGSAGALLAVGGGAICLVRRRKVNGDDGQPES